MSSTSEVDERLRQARAALKSGDPAAAAELFRQVIADNPDDAQAHEGLGTACFRLKDYDAAIEAFVRVTRLDPRQPRAWINLGAVYNRMGDHAAAIDALRNALARDRKSADAYYNMGLAHKGLNQLSLAVTAYREAVRLAPDMAEAHQNLANAYVELNNLRQAEAHYRKALELRPDFEKALRGLQHVQAKLDENQQERALGRLVAAPADAPPETATQAAPPAFTDEDRERILAAATRGNDAARELASALSGEFEKALLALAGIIARKSDQRLLVRDAHEDYRDALRTLVPLIQELSVGMNQLKALVNEDRNAE